MASYIFDHVKELIATQSINLVPNDDNVYKVVLVSADALNGTTYSKETYWLDKLSKFEITEVDDYNNIGYEPKYLKDVGIETISDAGGSCNDGLPDKSIYANNVVYNVSTIDADGAIILYSIPDNSEDYYPIAALDLRSDGATTVQSNNGTFKLLLNSENGGFLTIK